MGRNGASYAVASGHWSPCNEQSRWNEDTVRYRQKYISLSCDLQLELTSTIKFPFTKVSSSYTGVSRLSSTSCPAFVLRSFLRRFFSWILVQEWKQICRQWWIESLRVLEFVPWSITLESIFNSRGLIWQFRRVYKQSCHTLRKLLTRIAEQTVFSSYALLIVLMEPESFQ